ncbi:MAG: VCBS repeat-containing protein [Elusimicrobia bacterium]|nr:VCBS repeat-containing protein [Elusimicrobiota bacterium]
MTNWLSAPTDGTFYEAIGPGDFNGDGRSDNAYYRHGGSQPGTWVQVSQGNSLIESRWNSDAFLTSNPPRLWRLGEFNGDGRTDLLLIGLGNPASLKVGVSNGSVIQYQNWGSPTFDITNQTPLAIGDFNGDGLGTSLYFRAMGVFGLH